MCIINGCCEGEAISESIISNARYAIGDGDGGQRRATIESIISNTRYAVGDGDRGEGGAIKESTISNAGYAVGDIDRGEGGAIIESLNSNARDAVGDGDGGKGGYYDVLPPADIPAAIGECDAVVVNKARITAEIMDACPNLKFVGLFATGYNNIDTVGAAERGIVVCNVPGYSTQSVAQHTFALMLHFASRADEYAASVARGDWANAKTFSYLSFPSHELCGRTLAIYGYGNIGREVAAIGRAFGMKIIATPHSPRPAEEGVEFVDANELFARADYLSLHCPLTDETRHLVNAQTLALMKPTAYIINTARGGVIEEDALCVYLHQQEALLLYRF